MRHRLIMFVTPELLACVLALTVMTAFSAVGLTSALAMNGVAATTHGDKALPTLDGKPPLIIGIEAHRAICPSTHSRPISCDRSGRRGDRTRLYFNQGRRVDRTP